MNSHKIYPLPQFVKIGTEIECHYKHILNLSDSLRNELALAYEIPIEEFKIFVDKGVKGTIIDLDDYYVTIEFHTSDQICSGPWFNKMLRGDFAWYWYGTAEDFISRMYGVPCAEMINNI